MDVQTQTYDIEQSLLSEVPSTSRQNDLKSETYSKSKTNNDRSLIKNVNNQVLIDFLSPEISKNEKSKRVHKLILILLLSLFLVIQFSSVYTVSIKVIDYCTSNNADKDIVARLLAFVTGYITSVVVELIAILKYIVKNVFDTSIKELIQIFKEDNKSQNNVPK